MVNGPAIVVQARVRDALDRRLRWLFGTAAAAFGLLGGAVGLSMLGLAPVLAPLAVPALPWAPFAVAYAATATVLAWKIARAPRRETFLILVLAGGLVLSSLVSLAAALAATRGGPEGRVMASGAGIDLVVAVAFAAAWIRLWFASVPGEARERRDEHLLVSLLDVLVPAGGAVDAGATEPAVRETILARRSAVSSEVRIRLGLRLVDLASWVLTRESFAAASPDARSELLSRLCGSRVGALRRIALGWREAALAAYYVDPRVLDGIGFDRSYLRRRLFEGANREAHRARLDREPDSLAGDATPLQKPTADAPVLRLIRTGGPTSA